MAVSPVLDALDHPPAVEVPVLRRELVQSVQRPLQSLQRPSSGHWVFVAVRVLLVVRVCRQVAPEDVNADSKVQSEGVMEPQRWGGRDDGTLVWVHSEILEL